MKAVLYLIPVPISDAPADLVIPPATRAIINTLKEFVVEDIKTARRMLRKMGFSGSFDELNFHLLNEHTSAPQIAELAVPLKKGLSVGLMSEAGLPAIADPGSEFVRVAQEAGYRVRPLVGPSSVFLALMASGLNGQQFCFHGYLPAKKKPRIEALRKLEKKSYETGESQVFMETPYRNEALLQDILNHCRSGTLLCIASDITAGDEFIHTRTISLWKETKPEIHKHPAVFILSAAR